MAPARRPGALVLVNAPLGIDRDVFFRRLPRYGALIVVAPSFL